MTEKKRLDVIVFELGLTKSREDARKSIMAGQVYVNNQKADKPGATYAPSVHVELRGKKIPYVSRGGLKLEKAINSFNVSLTDKIAMDIGSSTGGFTDCMLINGASKVYSIDVGYGQLDWKLRSDSRVITMERTNFRYVTKEQIPEEIDFFSVDVSFISLCMILPPAHELLRPNGEGVCLIKPQFEAGRKNVGKKGVVRDPNVHKQVIEKICTFSVTHGFNVIGLDFSPIRGPQGNIEYLIHVKKSATPSILFHTNIEDLIAQANLI